MFGCTLDGFAHWGGWFTGAMFLLAGFLLTGLALRLGKKKPLNTDRIDSMEILKTRLAKGDITLDEYAALKSALLGTK